MYEIIPLHDTMLNQAKVRGVNARDLYDYLEVKSVFADWIKRRIDVYGFIQDIDFTKFLINETGTISPIEYHLSLDMAKQLAMVERTEKGKEARLYFIACEKEVQAQRHTPHAPTPLPLPSPTEQLALCQATYAFLEELGCATDRDRLAIADYARNGLRSAQGLLAAPASSPLAYGFSLAERVAQLGYHLTRAQQSALYGPLGKRLAAEYRLRTGEDPRKEPRYVDGATRPVAWYAPEEAAWVDPLIQGFLASLQISTATP